MYSSPPSHDSKLPVLELDSATAVDSAGADLHVCCGCCFL
jgi:hypothetical protein